MERYHLWINGREQPGKAGTLTRVEYPFDRTVWAEVTDASAADTEAALVAATQAAETMRELPAHRRAKILRRAAHLIEENHTDLAHTVVREVGKPIRDANREISRAAELFDLAADYARAMYGETLPMDAYPGAENRLGIAVRVPVGVISAITPFNSPINLSANKIAPGLAAGNAIVCKPSPRTPVSVLKLARILHEAGLPAGAFNVLCGDVANVAEPITRDARVRMVTFTGGVRTGTEIHRNAGLKKVTLELGSIAPNIVCEDVDVAATAKTLATSAFLSSGQACISAQRLIVHESVFEEFCRHFVQAAEAMKIGDPFDPATEIGPIVSEDSVNRLMGWIEEARGMGARILTGGTRLGNSILPTAVTDLPVNSSLYCDEAFGPIATLQPYRTIDEAIAMANDSPFGLQGGIFTNDINRALFMAQRVNVGGVWINDSSRFRVDLYPFGGMKQSGLGREGVKYAMEEMTDLKFIGIKMGGSSGIL